jgi:hypothetical protein
MSWNFNIGFHSRPEIVLLMHEAIKLHFSYITSAW